MLISRYSKLVYIIMFRISRYALAHSFAQKHRFHRSRSPLRSLFNLCFWTKYCTNSYQLIFNTYLFDSKFTINNSLAKILHATLCSTNCSLLLRKWYDFSCFNVSLFIYKRLIYKDFIIWNIRVVCFIFAFNVSSYKHWQ